MKNKNHPSFSQRYAGLKVTHPKTHSAIKILSTFLPPVLTFIPTLIFGTNEGFTALLVYAFFGSFTAGIGLSFWAFHSFEKEMFFNAAVYPIAIGGGVSLLSVSALCIPAAADILSPPYIDFQLIAIVLLFICGLFRSTVSDSMEYLISKRTGLTQKQLEDETEGFINGFFYSSLHKEYDLGILYFFNAAYLLLLGLLWVTSSAVIFLRILAPAVLLFGVAAALGSFAWSIADLVITKKAQKSPRTFVSYAGEVLLTALMIKRFLEYYSAL